MYLIVAETNRLIKPGMLVFVAEIRFQTYWPNKDMDNARIKRFIMRNESIKLNGFVLE